MKTTISRRRVLQGAGALAAGTAISACTSSQPATPPLSDKRPHVLMIVSDDIGYLDLECFGGEIPTPNLNRLADHGRRFTQLLTNPMCCPSRAALLTGLYPTQAGVGYYTWDEGSPGYIGHLNDNCVTIAQVLKSVGYRTAISGKWHVSPWTVPSAEPPARGFDDSFCEVGGNGFFTTERFLDGKLIGVSKNKNFYMTDAITGYAKNRIEEYAGGTDPFFIYVGYTAPHFPLQAPAAAVEQFHGRYKDGWDVLREARYQQAGQLGIIDPNWQLAPRALGVPAWDDTGAHDWQAARMEVYAAQVNLMDRGIGTLLDTLESKGVLDDTLVFFFGDNGACAEPILPNSRSKVPTRDGKPMRSGNVPAIYPGPSDTFCSYGLPWGSAGATPFRRYKLWVEEGGICTPLIASWPGRVPTGGIDHRPLHLMDFMPTLIDLAGAKYPSTYVGHAVHPLQGLSFADVLTAGSGPMPPPASRELYWEFMGHRAARRGDWKIVDDFETGAWSLYNMVADRTEMVNLASSNTSLVASMGADWEAWKQRVGVVDWNDKTQYRQS